MLIPKWFTSYSHYYSIMALRSVKLLLIPLGQQKFTDVGFGIRNAKDVMSMMLLQSFIRRGLGNVDK
jgi:hypothetical protein